MKTRNFKIYLLLLSFVVSLVIIILALFENYRGTITFAKDFVTEKSSELTTRMDEWLKERKADFRYLMKLQHTENFIFKGKTRLMRDSVELRNSVKIIAENHNYKNFWILDSNFHILFVLNPFLEFPKYCIDGKRLTTELLNIKDRDLETIIRVARGSFSEEPLILVISSAKFSPQGSNFFVVASFDFQMVLEKYIESYWSKYELLEYSFGYFKNDSFLVFLNLPNKYEGTKYLPLHKDIISQVKARKYGNPSSTKSVSDEKVISIIRNFARSDVFFAFSILQTKVMFPFFFTLAEFVVAFVFVVLGIFWSIGFVKEKSRRKQLMLESEYQRKLYLETKKYENFTREANDMIIVCDENFNIIEVNEKAYEKLRLTKEELSTRNILDLLIEEDREKLINDDGYSDKNLSVRLLDANQNVIFCTISRNEIEYNREKLLFFVITDVSEIVLQLKRIEKISRLLKSLSMVNGIILKKFELGEIFSRTCELLVMVSGFKSAVFYKYINTMTELILFSKFGYSLEEVLPEEIHIDNFLGNFPFVKLAIEKNEIVYLNDLSEYKPMTNSIFFLVNKGLNSVLIVPIFAEKELFGLFFITFSKEIEFDEESLLVLQEMKSDISFAVEDYLRDVKFTETEFKKNLFFNRSPNGFAIVDLLGKIIEVNKHLSSFFSKSSNELRDSSIFDLIPGEFHIEFENMLRRSSQGETSTMECYIDFDTGRRWLLISAEYIMEYNYFLLVLTDITEIKQAQFELEKEKQKAVELERLKSFILQNVSHEFRTPLNGIIGFANVIKSLTNDEDLIEVAAAIYSSAYRLFNTLDSLIVTSQIVSGTIKPRKEYVDLKELIQNFVKDVKFLIEDKPIDLKFETVCDDCVGYIDKEILSIILYILVSNAIKFTMRGEVEITLDRMKEGKEDYFLLKVRDTGIGISEGEKEKIFQMFRQGSEGLSRSFEGLGVGLFNAKMLLDLLGGSIDFTSEVNKGTTFFVKIPNQVE
jgi:PAS domain S-box-containing protein